MKRFGFVDDLRGIAAITVALSHLVWRLPEPFLMFELGRLGVEIFFIISGFVIAYSLRGDTITPGFVGHFFVRRSLRLDAVYWVVIAAHVAISVIVWRQSLPSFGDLVINAVYLQDLLGRPTVVSVAWTLAMELQFYLFFVILVGLTQFLDRRVRPWAALRLSPILYAGVAVLSVVTLVAPQTTELTSLLADSGGLFFPYWFMFFGGVVACWTFLGRLRSVVVWAYIAFVGGVYWGLGSSPLFPEDDLSPVFAVAVMGVLHLVGSTSVMTDGIGVGAIRYLGRISYSLYLTHWTIGVNFIYFISARFGDSMTLMYFATFTAIALSIASAHVLNVVVEEPSIRLGKSYNAWSSARPQRRTGSGTTSGHWRQPELGGSNTG